MALAIDTSTPALATAGAGTSLQSNSFSPPANSILVILVGFQPGVAGGSVSGITDSLGAHLTYNRGPHIAGTTCCSEIWWASCPSAQTNMTVTPSFTSSPDGCAVGVVVFTGAAVSQTGASATSSSASGTPSVTVSGLTQNNSWVVGTVSEFSNNDTPTIPSGQTDVFNGNTYLYLDASSGTSIWGQTTSSATGTSGGSVTLNDTAPTGIEYTMAALEIVPTGGGAVVDLTFARPVQITSRYVGPQALRFQFHRARMPIGIEGAYDPTVVTVIPLQIPSANVGPQALRHKYRRIVWPQKGGSSIANVLEEDFAQAEALAVQNASSIIRTFTESQTFTLVKAIVKTPITWTQSQALTLIRGVGKFLSIATQGESGTETRSSGKNIAATQTESFSFGSRAVAIIRAFTQGASARLARAAAVARSVTQGSSATASRQAGKQLAASEGQSGSMGHSDSHGVSVTQSEALAETKAAAHGMTATQGSSLLAIGLTKVKLLALAFTQGTAAVYSRQVGKLQAFTQSQAPTYQRNVAKVLLFTVSTAPTFLRSHGHYLTQPFTQGATATYQRAVTALRSTTQGESGAFGKALGKILDWLQSAVAALQTLRPVRQPAQFTFSGLLGAFTYQQIAGPFTLSATAGPFNYQQAGGPFGFAAADAGFAFQMCELA